MTVRLGVLTGGGDCPGLNAVIRAVVRAAGQRWWSVAGIADGFDGLLSEDDRGIMPLDDAAVRDILPRGGTILGTTNRGNPFQYQMRYGDRVVEVDRSREVVERVEALGLTALITIGGDGTLRIGHELARMGLRVVGVPKTIDNDLEATEVTFGFDTAVATATEALDRLHTTAESHHRVMLLEVMGRDAGWIALHAGIAGGSDAILIPEIPFRVERLVEHIERRDARGRGYSIVVVAEGARPVDGDAVYQADLNGDERAPKRLGGIALWLAEQLSGATPHEVRATVLGHLQRGGSPTSRDRVLATRFGTRAVDAVALGLFEHMVALRADRIEIVPLADAVARTKLVPVNGELVQTARDLGVCFGD